MILLFIIICLILALIFLGIFVYMTYKPQRKFTVVEYIDHCKYPTIMGLKNNGIFTNIINSPRDKIIIVFISGDDINTTYLNSTSFQLVDKENYTRLLTNDIDDYMNLFAYDYNISIQSPYRITSINNKVSYIYEYRESGFIKDDGIEYIVKSISPLVVLKNKKEEILNISWINTYGTLRISSNPIIINGYYWIIGSNDKYLVFVIFDIINKKVINVYSVNINFKVYNGLIYNKYNETFIIPIIKDNKIQIYNIQRNDLNI